jgi:hypothetical protein
LPTRAPDVVLADKRPVDGLAAGTCCWRPTPWAFGASLMSGQSMRGPRMGEFCGLARQEFAVYCVNIGPREQAKRRVRPCGPCPLSSLVPWVRQHRRILHRWSTELEKSFSSRGRAHADAQVAWKIARRLTPAWRRAP